MLRFYTALAGRLHRYRILFWLLFVLALAAFVGSVILSDGMEEQLYTLGSLAFLLWILSLVVLVESFVVPPPTIHAEDGFFLRARKRIARGIRWLIALAATVMLVLVMMFSVKAIGIMIRS